jgi:hypothetical protein
MVKTPKVPVHHPEHEPAVGQDLVDPTSGRPIGGTAVDADPSSAHGLFVDAQRTGVTVRRPTGMLVIYVNLNRPEQIDPICWAAIARAIQTSRGILPEVNDHIHVPTSWEPTGDPVKDATTLLRTGAQLINNAAAGHRACDPICAPRCTRP